MSMAGVYVLIFIAIFFGICFLILRNANGRDDAFIDLIKNVTKCSYKHYHNETAIGVDAGSKKLYLVENGISKTYDFSDIRKWRTNVSSGGEAVGGIVMTGGLAGSINNMQIIAANKQIQKQNEADSGLFINVKDIDNPLWHIKFKYDKSLEMELAKWMEILTQYLNEDKTDPEADLIEKLSEWSCDRESPQFMAQMNGLNENLRAQIHQRYMQKNTAKWHVFKARLDAHPEENRTVELRRQIRKEVGQLGI
jgi:hypothetical protein